MPAEPHCPWPSPPLPLSTWKMAPNLRPSQSDCSLNNDPVAELGTGTSEAAAVF